MNMGNFDPQLVSGTALDSRALNRLKITAGTDPKTAIRQTAKEFETLFTQMLLKSMREAVPQSGLMSTHAESTYTSMLDSELSRRVAEGNGGKGVGLAELIVNQLTQQMQLTTPPTQPTRREPAPREPSVAARTVAVTQAIQASIERGPAPTPGAREPSGVGAATGRIGKVSEARQNFVTTMMTHAKVAERATGIKADFMVGQAALESAWGKQEIKHPDGRTSHNLFGIKATGDWTGKTASVMTTEYVNGIAKKQVEKFRAYDSYAEAFKDYARLMKDNPRYQTAVSQGQSAAGFAKSLQKAGYATDPNYAAKLTSVINQTVKMSAALPRL